MCYRSGHYGVALLAYAPVLHALVSAGQVFAAAVGLAVVFAVTPLPDADHDFPLAEHRGVTHTLLFAGVVGVAAGGAAWTVRSPTGLAPDSAALFGASMGALAAFAMLAHLLADALTPMGVALFRPVSSRRHSLGLTSADSTAWNVGLFVLGVVATGAAAAFGVPLY